MKELDSIDPSLLKYLKIHIAPIELATAVAASAADACRAISHGKPELALPLEAFATATRSAIGFGLNSA